MPEALLASGPGCLFVTRRRAGGRICLAAVRGAFAWWFTGVRLRGSQGWPVNSRGEGVECVDAPFAGGGQVRLDDGEVSESLQGAPAAAGGPHLHLDGAYVPFCLIRGDPDGKVGGEPQDHVLVVAEPAGQ